MTIDDIEKHLDLLQAEFLNEEDEKKLREIERKFCELLDQATEVDGILRIARGVTITNWVKED